MKSTVEPAPRPQTFRVFWLSFFLALQICIPHTFQLQLHSATWLVWLDAPSRCLYKIFYAICTPTFRILSVHCLPTVHADCRHTMYCMYVCVWTTLNTYGMPLDDRFLTSFQMHIFYKPVRCIFPMKSRWLLTSMTILCHHNTLIVALRS
jgi:hypothetical protein